MFELIDNISAANEGSREFDGDIALQLGWQQNGKGWRHWINPEGKENQEVPFFTESVDAARSFIPGGWTWGISTHPDNEVFNPGGAQAYVTQQPSGDGYEHADAQTPELALCIAILKARSSVDGHTPNKPEGG